MQAVESGIPYQKPEWIHTSDVDKADFLQTVESSSDFGKPVCAMGQSLLAILRGEVEPLPIMLKDGLLERFYQRNTLLDQAYTHCTRWMKLFGYQKPQMRIIENGVGTGSATVQILNALSRHDQTTPRLRLEPGESVLIHAAAGGVGQAAFMIAQHIGVIMAEAKIRAR